MKLDLWFVGSWAEEAARKDEQLEVHAPGGWPKEDERIGQGRKKDK